MILGRSKREKQNESSSKLPGEPSKAEAHRAIGPLFQRERA
jgi:hypothetical protein